MIQTIYGQCIRQEDNTFIWVSRRGRQDKSTKAQGEIGWKAVQVYITMRINEPKLNCSYKYNEQYKNSLEIT